MRGILTGLALLFLGTVSLEAQETLLFRPGGAGEFFFSAADPVPRNLTGGEEGIVLDYGDWSYILSSGFQPSGRTLVQFFFDARRTGETLAGTSPSRPAGGAVFSRPWRGGSLSYSPLSPDRVTRIGERKETLLLEERPSGILMFFETGRNVFWLGNGGDFFCYDGEGAVLKRAALDGTALMASADSRGYLYLAFSDGAVRALAPGRGGDGGEKVISYGAWDLIATCYGDAVSLLDDEFPGYSKAFDAWIRETAEKLFLDDPLNRELGVFLRTFDGD